MSEITVRDGYKSMVVEVPDLGTATVSAGVNFFRLEWTDEMPLTVNRVDYKGDVCLILDDGRVTWNLRRAHVFMGDCETDSARRKILPVVEAFLAEFKDTDAGVQILAATVAKHRGFDLSGLADDIAQAEQHVAELKALKTRIEAADPTEHVSRYETTFDLRRRNR